MTTEMDRDELERLQRVARWALADLVSTSARNNVTEDIVSQAILEYWNAVQQGKVIENPEAFVTVITKRRAIDSYRRWQRDRHLRFGVDDDDLEGEMAIPLNDLPAAQEWVRGTDQTVALVEEMAGDGGDTLDVLIARMVLVEDRPVGEVADELGLAEQTVRNRMTAIKTRIRDHIETS